MTIKLWNKSKRTFIVGENVEFKPDTTRKFDKAAGERLAKMYPGELFDVDKIGEDVPEVADGDKEIVRNPVTGLAISDDTETEDDDNSDIHALKVPELKAKLEELGVEIPEGAKKAELQDLLEKHTK